MELPRNITQVGAPDKNCKVYVEDYVVSYMRQINKGAEDKRISVALFGRKAEEAQVTYYFVYGACLIQSITKEVKHLSQAQCQEIDRMRKKYFVEQEFLGYQILNGEMIEGFHICEQGGCRYINGYACFFEKNDTMLAYMLEARVDEAQPENVEQDKYEMVKKRQEERRARFEERQYGRKGVNKETERKIVADKEAEKTGSESGKFKMVPFVMTAAACFMVLTVLGNGNLQEKMNSRVLSWWEDIKQVRQEPVNIEETQSSVLVGQVQGEQIQAVMSTLVTEDKLADAILTENENASEMVIGDSVTEEILFSEEILTEDKATEMDKTENVLSGQSETENLKENGSTEQSSEENKMESETAVQKMESYVIQKGDTLIAISTSIYGSDAAVGQICALNNIANPDNIQIGQKILLP